MSVEDKQRKQRAKRGNVWLATRLAVVQTLYSEQLSEQEHIQQVAWLNEQQHHHLDEGFYQKLLRATQDRPDAILAVIEKSLQDRKWQNLDIILQKILICAVAEIYHHFNDTALVISVYCSISDSFYDDNMGKFVNGVLQNCADQIDAMHAQAL